MPSELERFLPVVDGHILRLLLGPDGMRQSVVAGLHFPEEKFSAVKRNISSNPRTHSTRDLVNSSRGSFCLSFCWLDSRLLPGSVERYFEFEAETKAWAHGVFNPK